MMGRRRVTVNIEAHEARAVVLRGNRVLRWHSIALGTNLVQDGVVQDPEALGASIRALLDRIGAPTQSTRCTLPASLLPLTRLLELPKLPRREMGEVVLAESNKVASLMPEQFYFFWRTLKTHQGLRQVLPLWLPKGQVEGYVKALRAAGLRPKTLELKPLALLRAVGRQNAIVANLEPGHLNVTLALEGLPRLFRSVRLPPDRWGESLAEALAGEIGRTVRFYGGTNGQGASLASLPLVLTGQASQDPLLREHLESLVSNPLEPFAPAVRHPADFPSQEYAANLGLATGRGGPKGLRFPPINVLPEPYRPQIPIRRSGFALALALGLISLALLFRAAQDAASQSALLRGQLKQANFQVELQRLDARKAAAIQQGIDSALETQRELQREYQEIQGRREPHAGLMRKVMGDLPPQGVEVTEVGIDGARVDVKGNASELAPILDYVRSLRLRGGFSRVELASATSGQPAGGQEADTSLAFVIRIAR